MCLTISMVMPLIIVRWLHHNNTASVSFTTPSTDQKRCTFHYIDVLQKLILAKLRFATYFPLHAISIHCTFCVPIFVLQIRPNNKIFHCKHQETCLFLAFYHHSPFCWSLSFFSKQGEYTQNQNA